MGESKLQRRHWLYLAFISTMATVGVFNAASANEPIGGAIFEKVFGAMIFSLIIEVIYLALIKKRNGVSFSERMRNFGRKVKKYLPDILIQIGIFFFSGSIISSMKMFTYHPENQGTAIFAVVILAIGSNIVIRRYLGSKKSQGKSESIHN